MTTTRSTTTKFQLKTLESGRIIADNFPTHQIKYTKFYNDSPSKLKAFFKKNKFREQICI